MAGTAKVQHTGAQFPAMSQRNKRHAQYRRVCSSGLFQASRRPSAQRLDSAVLVPLRVRTEYLPLMRHT